MLTVSYTHLLLIGELGHRLLVLFMELLNGLFIVFLGLDVLLSAAGDHGLIIGAVVGLEVALSLGDELGDLGLVLCLDLLGLGAVSYTHLDVYKRQAR